MQLRVFVICPECHRQREVAVEGPAATVSIEHDCDADRAYEVRVGEPDAQLRLAA